MSDERSNGAAPEGAKVFIGVPFYQHFPGECIDNTEGCVTAPNDGVICRRGEAYVDRNFSGLWCSALNSRKEGKWTHFCMVHVDVQPHARHWLDLLLAEQKRCGADLLGVVLPIKSPQGISSTAVMDEGGRIRRLTMHELDAIPELTFDAEGAGFPGCKLLNSTGLWVCDFTKPWAEEMWFETRCRIVRRPGGEFVVESSLEDWHFSQLFHARGLKVMATKLLSCSHWGSSPYPNDRPWGTVRQDSWAPKREWFDDPVYKPARTTYEPKEAEPCPQ